ncbi:MAG: site-specific DNA-methyltransferase [Chloroflexi bacterium]|nr:site-specific DNA-methyltransferase [Chloroflexota bacterium]
MRTLASESVDLIYIDPPFFSNRVYNVIWGDEHEERSFSDIWEGGLDGYLIWLNARLYEMKRLLKPTGSIYVHCDWHASHYIKVEMDKVFGYQNFQNEVVWSYRTGGSSKSSFAKKHDVILFYARARRYTFVQQKEKAYTKSKSRRPGVHNYGAGTAEFFEDEGGVYNFVNMRDVWEIPYINSQASERVGYPTQKPEALIERVILASSNEGDTVLDAFVGGGTTAVVAQRLGRRWIAIDQSRVAAAVTAERLKSATLERELGDAPIPDFNIEHWGVYEAERLSSLPGGRFRNFILDCYDARIPSADDGIHGYKGSQARVPVWVGGSSLTSAVGAREVNDFAQAIARLDRYQGDEGLRDGVMLAWGFRPDARHAADELREREGVSLAFVRLQQVTIDSPAFRQHITRQSTERGDYTGFLTFVQPPLVRVAHRRVRPLHYEFDASDTQAQNADAKILNVQWDFDYDGVTFRAGRGEWFHRKSKGGAPVLDAQHSFERPGLFRVACRVQDDKGGEGEWSGEIEVE